MAFFTGTATLSKREIVALADAVSVALSEGLSTDDMNAAGNLIVTIGGMMLTFASLETAKPAAPEAEVEAPS